MTFAARSRQTEHSRKFLLAGMPSFLHEFMMFRNCKNAPTLSSVSLCVAQLRQQPAAASGGRV
jgi:hypothetical protein